MEILLISGLEKDSFKGEYLGISRMYGLMKMKGD